MHPLAQELLGRFSQAADEISSPQLAVAMQDALAGKGSLLRVSCRRLVLRCGPHQQWLLKLDAPQRWGEAWRNLWRPPALAREWKHWQSLFQQEPSWQHLIPDCLHQQLSPGRGVFLRSWLDGKKVEDWDDAAAEVVGRQFAYLHQLGWSDPDLQAEDLLLVGESLLPLDLGHALIQDKPTPPRWRRRDWLALLASLSQERRQQLAPALFRGYEARQALDWSLADCMDAAHRQACHALRRQSKRCWRRTRDFTPEGASILRTECPWQGDIQQLFGHQGSQGREVFSRLYELELHGFPALRPLQLQMQSSGQWQLTACLPSLSPPLQSASAATQSLRHLGWVVPAEHSSATWAQTEGAWYLRNPQFLHRVKPVPYSSTSLT